MLIRSATLADLPAIMALESQSATAAHWSEAQYQFLFAESAPHRAALVLEDQAANCIQGFLIARALDADKKEWEIENIVVAELFRGRGLGSCLLKEFLHQTRTQGAESVFLEVRESNQSARKLYQKCAFVENGRRSRYYSVPQEDAVLYRFSFS